MTQVQFSTPIIIIPMEDPILHTATNGYLCSDPGCICHVEHEQAVRDQLAHEDEARREWLFNVPMEDEA